MKINGQQNYYLGNIKDMNNEYIKELGQYFMFYDETIIIKNEKDKEKMRENLIDIIKNIDVRIITLSLKQ